jgi:uracil-DNA glycosylase family 4
VTSWDQHVHRWGDCQACPLATQRDRICLARGTLPCDVLLVGEAPGASEDALGIPFVGPAGQLLDQIIERSIPQEIAYALTNLVCCFPRLAKAEGINEPEKEEILACRPRLVEFVNVAQPRLIVCVGGLARDYIDHADIVKCVDINHPAWMLRLPLAQRQSETQHAIVIVRMAVVEMLSTLRIEWKEWGTKYAEQGRTQRERLRAEFDEIPF